MTEHTDDVVEIIATNRNQLVPQLVNSRLQELIGLRAAVNAFIEVFEDELFSVESDASDIVSAYTDACYRFVDQHLSDVFDPEFMNDAVFVTWKHTLERKFNLKFEFIEVSDGVVLGESGACHLTKKVVTITPGCPDATVLDRELTGSIRFCQSDPGKVTVDAESECHRFGIMAYLTASSVCLPLVDRFVNLETLITLQSLLRDGEVRTTIDDQMNVSFRRTV